MPVDEDGNRADIVMDPNATISRMNLGRLYEQYINAASRDVVKKLRTSLGVTQGDPQAQAKLAALEKSDAARFELAWDYLLNYYRIVSPRMYIWFTTGQYKGTRVQHLASILTDAIYLYLPPENEPEYDEIVRELERHYRPTYGPVTYVGNSGERITTKNPVRIGSLYVMLLEKIGDDWTAVSSGKLQHFGVLSQVTNTDKYSQPSRTNAIRALGEPEVRIYTSYVGPKITADILDRSNNPATHKEILHTILRADKPTNITSVIDRQKVPLGGSKPLQLIKHIGSCAGWVFHYEQHIPSGPYHPTATAVE